MIKEILKFDNNIQSSINIDLDYNDESKRQSYILTSKSVEIINDLISTFDDKNKNKSKILIGPYGKGKSHLALYIMGLMSESNRSEDKYELLLRKSKEQGESVYNNISNFIISNKKYLPVVLNSTPYNKNFSDILIYSLKNALEINEIENIELDFYFEKALNKIDTWEQQYKLTFNQFNNILNDDINIFKEKLRSYDKKSYEKFKKVYKEVMAGEEFNPYFEINPIEIYRETSIKLKEKGYSGIYVLYDEFSKYIEHLIAQNSVLDIKLMQDFAEFCNRSNEQEVHLLLISHKSIAQYTDKASKGNIDTWKAIEGRFDEIQYNDFSNQQYEIISSAIKKDKDIWEKFKSENNSIFDVWENNNILRSLFKELSDDEYKNWIVYGSYPMHPLATYSLPRISERVAQNERTLFSFLCKNEMNSLSDYITRNNEEIKLNTIYDYFEDNIMSLGYTDETHKILIRANKIIDQLDNELCKNIVKSIAIIHMINNFSMIKPNHSSIEILYGDNGIKALKQLMENNHIIQRNINDILDISTDKDIEILTEIRNVRENNSNLDIIYFLNNNFKSNFVEARRHNDENSIIRYFKVKFAKDNIDSKYVYEDIKHENADGIIYITSIDVKEISNDLEVLFIKNTIAPNIEETIKDLAAIKKLKNSKNSNVVIKSELDSLELKYENIIKNYITEILNLKFNNSVMYKNEVQDINNGKELSNKLSDIMDKVFFNTPIINNEMINKTEPSKVVIGARKKIIDQIVDYKRTGKIIFRKGSLESTILRSILLMNNAMATTNNDGEYKLNYNILNSEDNCNFAKLVNLVDDTIRKSIKKEVSLLDIYDIFSSPKFGFGMKKGPIPIVLAFTFSKYKKYLSIIENGREIPLSSDTIELLNSNPENYTIRLEKISDEKEEYISKLEALFVDYINMKERNEGDLTYLTLGIKKWFLYLSKYTKDTKKIYVGNGKTKRVSKEIIKFKNKLRILNENSIRFLFEDMVDIFEVGEYKRLIEKISEVKDNIDSYDNILIKNISNDIKQIFDLNENTSLNNGLYQWIENIDKSISIINGSIGKFSKLIEENKELNDTKSYLNKLSNYILGLYVADWNDNTPKIFIDKLNEIKNEIKNASIDLKERNKDLNILELAMTKEVDLSNRANMLLYDLKDTLEDYGGSVTEEEKRTILIEILKEIK